MVAAGDRPFRVLVLGGTGVFGGRLCRLLAGNARIALTIAARDRSKVDELARELGASGLAFDYRRDLVSVLAQAGYDVLVHTAGPFQGQDYAVAEICIRHGVHYLDLADDRAFVCGIDRLDEAARAAGVLVCAGVSTAPAITGAVVETAVSDGMTVDRVVFGIAPGNDAPRGRALVEAILLGAGKPIPGQAGRRVWGTPRLMRMPGLGRRWISSCDLPEPDLFGKRFGVRDTDAGAGLELSVLHLGLWALTALVRLGIVRSLVPMARPLTWIADRLRRLGTDRGGLRIDIEGGGRRRTWSLLAEGGDGPFVPAIPAAALVRKLAGHRLDRRGASACVGLLTLAELEAEMGAAYLRIGAGWGDDGASLLPSLYRRALGRTFDRLPAVCQRLHEGGASTWEGRCSVDGAQSLLGRLIAWVFQFPPSVTDGPILVDFVVRDGGERWTRHVGGRSMGSEQYIGIRKPAGWIVERFGLMSFDLELRLADNRLDLIMRGARILGVPLPRIFWPRVEAFESGEGGVYRFHVEIGLPLIGRLVRYRGSLDRCLTSR